MATVKQHTMCSKQQQKGPQLGDTANLNSSIYNLLNIYNLLAEPLKLFCSQTFHQFHCST